MAQLFSQLQSRHNSTTAYRPQANGRVERMHKILKTILAKLTEEDRTKWPHNIWKALLGIRTMVNESTGYTPVRLLYGFDLRTPTNWQPAPDRELDEPTEQTIANRMQEMDLNFQQPRERAAQRSINNQERQGRRYNNFVMERAFKENDLSPTSISQSAKFSQLYEGPYTVVRPMNNGAYLITDNEGAEDIVHVDRLKPYSAYRHMIKEVVAASKPLRSVLQRFRQP